MDTITEEETPPPADSDTKSTEKRITGKRKAGAVSPSVDTSEENHTSIKSKRKETANTEDETKSKSGDCGSGATRGGTSGGLDASRVTKMTVLQLRDELSKRKLDPKGSKPQLISRLQQALEDVSTTASISSSSPPTSSTKSDKDHTKHSDDTTTTGPTRKRQKKRRKEEEDDTRNEDVDNELDKDPSLMTVAELKEELEARDLETKGNKAVLISRLKKAINGKKG